ncbi:MAG: YeeE/YedE thiosulfate transporter family protein, partial [Herbaspirillum sp.]
MKRLPLAAAMAAFFIALVWFVSTRQAILFLVGIGFGTVLAGTRFGFTTGWRRLVEQRDPRGVLAQLLLMAVAAALSMPLLSHFPELSAALGPPSISLLIGAFVFGLCMQVADGCGSGTLYKAGMGTPHNMVVLPLFAIGSFLGSAHIDRWLSLGQIQPIGLVSQFGAPEAFGITCLGLAALAWAALRWSRGATPWFDRRLYLGALALAVLAALNLLIAGQSWGIVYGFGLWAGKVATAIGAFDPASNWFW